MGQRASKLPWGAFALAGLVVLLAASATIVVSGSDRSGTDAEASGKVADLGAKRELAIGPSSTGSTLPSAALSTDRLSTTVAPPATTASIPRPPVSAAPPPPAGASPAGSVRAVGPGRQYPTVQAALDAAQPGDTVQLAVAGEHPGPARSRRDGAAGQPIVITAVDGARLTCPGGTHRCLELNHSWYRLDGMRIEGGSSNLYLVGAAGIAVHDVQVVNSTFRGRSGTGECIRIKYQASRVEVGHNDIADCGVGKCCDGSKNGEGVYIGTAPEQLASHNPSPEPDRTHGVWVHHNVIRPYNECVDIKEGAYGNVVEHNVCSGQRDPESGAFGSRGGRVGEGNVFRLNTVEDALGACVRFGGDDEPDGTGNDFVGNTCRDIAGEYGVKQMRSPQGAVCGNVFEGTLPSARLSRDEAVDPTAGC